MALNNLISMSNLHRATNESVAKYRANKPLVQRIVADGTASGLPSADNIPDPALFGNWGEALNLARLPSTAECAAHLKLVQAFRAVQQGVMRSPSLSLHFESSQKWSAYATLAAIRFLSWWKAGDVFPSELPPLDVLMVWHSFLLNAQLFRDTCHGKSLYSVPFPWLLVHKTVSNVDWAFKSSENAAAAFTKATKMPPDLFDHLEKSYKGGIGHSRYSFKNGGLHLANGCSVDPTSTAALDVYCTATRSVDHTLMVKLRDAVIRQATFWEKMNGLLWIRSPTLADTIRRALGRYARFLRLCKQFPGTLLVPTLDVDLVWHTHQCWPESYDEGTRVHVGRFIDHDDTMGTGKLQEGRRATNDLYTMLYGEQYNVCGCWECQALITAMEDPSIRADGQPDMDMIASGVERRVEYYQAVEANRKWR
jgi:hypothetical protein